ncbi:MAG: FtsB family cell division protein [Dermatophilaceae bacterium]
MSRRPRPAWAARFGGASAGQVRRVAALLTIGVFLAVLLGPTIAAWLGQRADIAALREQVADQERDVAALDAERDRWRDPAYVEQQARQRLKFVKPGERSYTVIDPEPDPGAVDPIPEVVVAGEPDLSWYAAVWESARTADAPGQRR